MFWFYIVLALLAGLLLGTFFFGGLWWTVQKITDRGGSAYLFLISFIVRTGIVLGGLYLIMTAGWQFLISAMVGFLVARTILAYRFKPGAET